MIIYCDTKGNALSVPSSVPFGSALLDITIIAPRTTSTVVLKLKPPIGEYLPDVICAPSFELNGMSVFTAKLPEDATNSSGRCWYQVEFHYNAGERITTYRGSFNVAPGVLADMPNNVDQLKQYTINDLYNMLSNVTILYREIENVKGFVGYGIELQTVTKTLASAINELKATGGGGGGSSGGGIYFQTDKTLTLKDGILSVNTATKTDRDLPIKGTDVDVIVGNIEVLLETI